MFLSALFPLGILGLGIRVEVLGVRGGLLVRQMSDIEQKPPQAWSSRCTMWDP